MGKTPDNDLSTKIAAHLQRAPAPTISGTQSSILSMQVAAKQNPLVLRKPAKASRPQRQSHQGRDARDLHTRALKKYMNPTPGREHQDRLEAFVLHTLGHIKTDSSKADGLMTLVLLSNLVAAIELRPSLFRTPKTTSGQVKVQISDSLWLGYMFVVVCVNLAYREQGNKNIEAATIRTIRDIEKCLPSGRQMDHLLPDGEPKIDERKPTNPGSEEISQRDRRYGNLARRITRRRKVLEAGKAPMIAQVAYRWFNSGEITYANMINSAVAALLVSHEPESMLAKAQLPTAE